MMSLESFIIGMGSGVVITALVKSEVQQTVLSDKDAIPGDWFGREDGNQIGTEATIPTLIKEQKALFVVLLIRPRLFTVEIAAATLSIP